MTRGNRLAALIGILFLSGASVARADATPGQPDIPRPNIADKTFNITDYGAKPDGTTENTAAIQKSIDACKIAGGGTVIVPAGRFVTGPITLASNLNLRLEKEATLLLSNDINGFPMVGGRYQDAIQANDCHDLAITGSGTIDGQGQPWWDRYRKRKDGTDPRESLPHRPHLIALSHCTRVLVQGVTLTNSPMFHLVPSRCDDVVIDRIRILAPADAPNTDGIDPSGHNFLISHCFFDTGDDCIALKPAGKVEGNRLSCEDFLITDCTFRHGHGMSIGGQTPAGLRHLIVRDCTFDSTEAGIRMKANRGSGGLVEDLTYENLTMKNVKVAILITSYYPKIPADVLNVAPEPVKATTPIWRHIRINNVTGEGGQVAGQILGLPEMPVSDVVMTNVKISAEKGMQIVHARGIKFVNSQVTAASGPTVMAQDAEVEGLDVK